MEYLNKILIEADKNIDIFRAYTPKEIRKYNDEIKYNNKEYPVSDGISYLPIRISSYNPVERVIISKKHIPKYIECTSFDNSETKSFVIQLKGYDIVFKSKYIMMIYFEALTNLRYKFTNIKDIYPELKVQ